MAYTVLARKYRSWTFDQLVGQEAVATTLKNAIASGRVHHGYLFCGTRGVGKTSAARILARSLNCLARDGPTAEPCCKCDSCLPIAEGQDVDVIEIDAASNTGVDNIRELRSNTIYRPARSRFKIYIIDEVHMLSTGAFNALLKTLEEPPGHVKFIMATTEPQKVPATIRSRCQHFDFRSISVDRIAGHFEWILKQEKVKADDGVLRRVARLANGSMRDGLSLLDQLLAMGGDRLTMQMVDDILPTPHDETLLRLVGQFADHDAGEALASVDACLAGGYSLERLCESLAEQIRGLMLLNVCGPETSLIEVPGGVREEMTALAKRFEPESLVFMIAVLEDLRRNVRFSSLGRALVEAAVVRLAGSVSYRSVQSLLDELTAGSSGPGSTPAQTPQAARPQTGAVGATRSSSSAPAKAQPARPQAGEAKNGPPSSAAPPARRGAGQKAAPAGQSDVAPPASTPPARRGRPASSEDVKQARGEPIVRQAIDLFGGRLVNVERLDDSTGVEPGVESPEPPNGSDEQ
ncbi:MAG TPA: DNA polymerase III subunit gamma/tau [Phycisphaerae bacterium]|nr:DNA polymerase III subunit gamma/tau [Phycisphaerae bacterium]